MLCFTLVAAVAEEAAPKRVALVFDDGPVPENACPLLALLNQEGIQVTFALVGKRVDEHPEIVQNVTSAGHEAVNHSQTHAHPRDLTDAALNHEVGAAQRTIAARAGIAPRWYWPPFLELDDRVRTAAAHAGITPYVPRHLVVSMDYDRSVLAAEIVRRSTTQVHDGSVILFHEWRAETRQQLPAILSELRRQNCRFYTFSGLHESLTVLCEQ